MAVPCDHDVAQWDYFGTIDLSSQKEDTTMTRKLIVLWTALFIMFCTAYQAESADMTPGQLVKEAKAAIKEVSISDVKKMIDAKEQVILLDVRDKNEIIDEGIIPGATNLSRGMLEFKAAMMIPDKNARIIVYCGLDLRSPLATKTLNDLGYKNAVNMVGGLKAWKEAGYPLVK
jgi:rhodanese-related sulfurtransferase